VVTCYIGIGSNLGDRKRFIDAAIEKMKRAKGVTVVRASSLYETDPVGAVPQGKFLNGVLEIETDRSAREVLRILGEIEDSLGRTREIANGPRTIDLDLLLYGDEVIDERDLVVPHPRMHEREFVLKPLKEIAPDFVHPTLKVMIKDIGNR
jgi:2-amino-4-hydroxy-6-hydroxymethyldihydropteridine diphosphokinase